MPRNPARIALLGGVVQALLLGSACWVAEVSSPAALVWAGGMSVWAVLETRARPPLVSADDGDLSTWVGVLSLLSVLVVSLLDTGSLGTPVGWVLGGGALLLTAGVWLRVSAIRVLGESFRARPGHQRPVMGGPYALMRHPAELGLVACALGSALCLGSLWGLALSLVVLPWISDWRVGREEAVMRASGEAYHAYAQRVPRWGL